MPPLPNPRWERFAQELATGRTADEAYQSAGYRADRKNAHRLTTKDGIRERVTELKRRAALRAEVTTALLLDEAERARLLAMKLGQPSAAVVAIKEKGILSGLRIEKLERKTVTVPRRLSDAELEAIVAGASPVPAGASSGSRE